MCLLRVQGEISVEEISACEMSAMSLEMGMEGSTLHRAAAWLFNVWLHRNFYVSGL